MESYNSFGGRIGFVCLCLGIFLLLQNVDAKLNKTDPTDNVNLAPFDAWLSAYYCLNRTVPSNCNKTGQLTDQGLIYVAPNDVQEYCNPESGCAKHALDVLKCVYLCKRDFWFHNNATVADINQTINDGCAKNSTAISTMDYKSSGIKLNQKIYIPLIASLSTLAYIAMSNIM